jgi:hypothetical protein
VMGHPEGKLHFYLQEDHHHDSVQHAHYGTPLLGTGQLGCLGP